MGDYRDAGKKGYYMEERLSNALNLHRKLVESMSEALIAIGYPSESIVKERAILIDGRKYVADLIVLGEDGTSLLSVFEMKTGRQGPEHAFMVGKSDLCSLPKQYSCFVVTQKDGKCVLANACDAIPNWVDATDKTALLNLVGAHLSKSKFSKKQLSTNVSILTRRDWIINLCTIGGSGYLLVLICVILEACGLKISWKPYALYVVTAGFCVALSGKLIHTKVTPSGAEFTILPLEYKDLTMIAQKELANEGLREIPIK